MRGRGNKFYIPSTGKCIVLNQGRVGEDVFPYQNQDMIEGKLAEDNNLEILSQVKHPVKWMDFTSDFNLDNNFEKVYVASCDHYIIRSKFKDDVHMKLSRE
jgi:hypothetical protein